MKLKQTIKQLMIAKVIILAVCFISFAQPQGAFEVTGLSQKFDVKIEVERLRYSAWVGKASFSIFRKGAANPFQVIRLDETYIYIEGNGQPRFSSYEEMKKTYEWSSLYFIDYNFDGHDDLVIPDGDYGGYRGISYRIYLYDPAIKRFVHSPSFSRLSQGPYINVPDADASAKTLKVFSKSGCCMHFEEIYKVIKGRPVKIVEINTYHDLKNDGYNDIETRKLIRGRWRTWNKRVKANP